MEINNKYISTEPLHTDEKFWKASVLIYLLFISIWNFYRNIIIAYNLLYTYIYIYICIYICIYMYMYICIPTLFLHHSILYSLGKIDGIFVLICVCYVADLWKCSPTQSSASFITNIERLYFKFCALLFVEGGNRPTAKHIIKGHVTYFFTLR